MSTLTLLHPWADCDKYSHHLIMQPRMEGILLQCNQQSYPENINRLNILNIELILSMYLSCFDKEGKKFHFIFFLISFEQYH